MTYVAAIENIAAPGCDPARWSSAFRLRNPIWPECRWSHHNPPAPPMQTAGGPPAGHAEAEWHLAVDPQDNVPFNRPACLLDLELGVGLFQFVNTPWRQLAQLQFLQC